MKKLMVIAAVAFAAFCSQGAAVTWGFSSGAIHGPTEAYNDGDGFLIGGLATLMLQNAEGGWDTAFSGVTMDPDSFTWGSVDPENPANSPYVIGTSGQAYKLILTTEDGKYELVTTGVSAEQKVTTFDDPILSAGMLDGDEHFAGEWAAVPEPTSGLLLLLGVAGLALRRRRA